MFRNRDRLRSEKDGTFAPPRHAFSLDSALTETTPRVTSYHMSPTTSKQRQNGFLRNLIHFRCYSPCLDRQARAVANVSCRRQDRVFTNSDKKSGSSLRRPRRVRADASYDYDDDDSLDVTFDVLESTQETSVQSPARDVNDKKQSPPLQQYQIVSALVPMFTTSDKPQQFYLPQLVEADYNFSNVMEERKSPIGTSQTQQNRKETSIVISETSHQAAEMTVASYPSVDDSDDENKIDESLNETGSLSRIGIRPWETSLVPTSPNVESVEEVTIGMSTLKLEERSSDIGNNLGEDNVATLSAKLNDHVVAVISSDTTCDNEIHRYSPYQDKLIFTDNGSKDHYSPKEASTQQKKFSENNGIISDLEVYVEQEEKKDNERGDQISQHDLSLPSSKVGTEQTWSLFRSPYYSERPDCYISTSEGEDEHSGSPVREAKKLQHYSPYERRRERQLQRQQQASPVSMGSSIKKVPLLAPPRSDTPTHDAVWKQQKISTLQPNGRMQMIPSNQFRIIPSHSQRSLLRAEVPRSNSMSSTTSHNKNLFEGADARQLCRSFSNDNDNDNIQVSPILPNLGKETTRSKFDTEFEIVNRSELTTVTLGAWPNDNGKDLERTLSYENEFIHHIEGFADVTKHVEKSNEDTNRMQYSNQDSTLLRIVGPSGPVKSVSLDIDFNRDGSYYYNDEFVHEPNQERLRTIDAGDDAPPFTKRPKLSPLLPSKRSFYRPPTPVWNTLNKNNLDISTTAAPLKMPSTASSDELVKTHDMISLRDFYETFRDRETESSVASPAIGVAPSHERDSPQPVIRQGRLYRRPSPGGDAVPIFSHGRELSTRKENGSEVATLSPQVLHKQRSPSPLWGLQSNRDSESPTTNVEEVELAESNILFKTPGNTVSPSVSPSPCITLFSSQPATTRVHLVPAPLWACQESLSNLSSTPSEPPRWSSAKTQAEFDFNDTENCNKVDATQSGNAVSMSSLRQGRSVPIPPTASQKVLNPDAAKAALLQSSRSSPVQNWAAFRTPLPTGKGTVRTDQVSSALKVSSPIPNKTVTKSSLPQWKDCSSSDRCTSAASENKARHFSSKSPLPDKHNLVSLPLCDQQRHKKNADFHKSFSGTASTQQVRHDQIMSSCLPLASNSTNSIDSEVLIPEPELTRTGLDESTCKEAKNDTGVSSQSVLKLSPQASQLRASRDSPHPAWARSNVSSKSGKAATEKECAKTLQSQEYTFHDYTKNSRTRSVETKSADLEIQHLTANAIPQTHASLKKSQEVLSGSVSASTKETSKISDLINKFDRSNTAKGHLTPPFQPRSTNSSPLLFKAVSPTPFNANNVNTTKGHLAPPFQPRSTSSSPLLFKAISPTPSNTNNVNTAKGLSSPLLSKTIGPTTSNDEDSSRQSIDCYSLPQSKDKKDSPPRYMSSASGNQKSVVWEKNWRSTSFDANKRNTITPSPMYDSNPKRNKSSSLVPTELDYALSKQAISTSGSRTISTSIDLLPIKTQLADAMRTTPTKTETGLVNSNKGPTDSTSVQSFFRRTHPYLLTTPVEVQKKQPLKSISPQLKEEGVEAFVEAQRTEARRRLEKSHKQPSWVR